MKLLIVDGSNIVMRCAFGGDIPPAPAVATATGMVQRCAKQYGATHLVMTLDSSAPSWRKQEYPAYKGNRTGDTSRWLAEAFGAWSRLGWWVEECAGFEADDVIATLAVRAKGKATGASLPPDGTATGASPLPGRAVFDEVMVLSGDSDLLPLLEDGVWIIKPVNGGNFLPMTWDDVRSKYGVAPGLLPELKAMTGESGDNIPGVDGIGRVRAAALLSAYGSLLGVITAGKLAACKYSAAVAAQECTSRLALRLVSLVRTVPVLAIKPRECAL